MKWLDYGLNQGREENRAFCLVASEQGEGLVRRPYCLLGKFTSSGGSGCNIEGSRGLKNCLLSWRVPNNFYMPPSLPPMYLVMGYGGAQGRKG